MHEEPGQPARPDHTSGGQQRTVGDDDRKSGTTVASFAALGLQFAASILLFLFVGRWLDRQLGTEPWLLILGVFVGAGAAFYSMYRRLMAEQQREESLRKK